MSINVTYSTGVKLRMSQKVASRTKIGHFCTYILFCTYELEDEITKLSGINIWTTS